MSHGREMRLLGGAMPCGWLLHDPPLVSHAGELPMESTQRGWLGMFAHYLLDMLCALRGRQQRCIQFEIVDAMAVDLLIMSFNQARKAITPCTFSLFGDL
jgi:hypothetical protein